MTYNPLPDLAVFGLILIGLGIAIRVLDRKPRGATKADRKGIIDHQLERRIRMHPERRARHIALGKWVVEEVRGPAWVRIHDNLKKSEAHWIAYGEQR